MPPIYLDYQASTPLLPAVKNRMIDILDGISGNPHSALHLHGREAGLIVEKARDKIAELIGSEAENIVFTSGATEANNFLIRKGAALNPKRRTILVGATEHKCVLETAHDLRKHGYKIIEIRTDGFGNIDQGHFTEALSDDVALVSIMSANNEIGTLTNIKPLISSTHKVGALFHTDAAQYISHSALDVNDLDADFISLSSHKMYGPKGIGVAYIAPHLFEEISPLLFGGGQEDGKRGGTLSPLLCGGFGEAANQYLEIGSDIREKTKAIRDHFYSGLQVNLGDDIALIGPKLHSRHISNLNIQFNQPSSTLLGRIAPILSASNGSACASGQIDTSHVLRAIGLSAKEAANCIRFSFGVGLSVDDIDRALSEISTILRT